MDTFTENSPDEVLVDASWQHAEDLGFARADFAWTSEKTDGAATPSRSAFHLQIDEEVLFKQGAFNLIVGPTGCGSSPFSRCGGSASGHSNMLFAMLAMFRWPCKLCSIPIRNYRFTKFASYLGMYCVIVALTIISSVYCTLVYTYGSLRASRTIHARLVKSLLGSTFR